MKRINILTAMKKFLTQQQINSVFEIKIGPKQTVRGLIEKQRSVFISGLQANNRQELNDFLEGKDINFELRYYANLDSLEQSNLVDRESFQMENNWRGRILRFNQDFNWGINDAEFDRVFLKSYFRLILAHVNGEYFGKHDVAPVFYSPGQSTAGFQDFRGAVEGILSFINRGREYDRNPCDPAFDYLKVFTSIGMNQVYQVLSIDGHQDTLIENLFNQIDNQGITAVTDWLYQQINDNWQR